MAAQTKCILTHYSDSLGSWILCLLSSCDCTACVSLQLLCTEHASEHNSRLCCKCRKGKLTWYLHTDLPIICCYLVTTFLKIPAEILS